MNPTAVIASRIRRPEVVSLTTLRGCLAFWVVLYHFWNDIVRLFPRVDCASKFVVRGNMAVPAFFMLSGYVLSYNYAEQFQTLSAARAGRFVILRLARIYPVHFVSLLIVLGMVMVSHRVGFKLTDAGYSGADFVRNLLLIQTWVPHFKLNWNYPSWSISSEWFAYLLLPFAIAFGLRRLTTFRRAAIFGFLALIGSVLFSIFCQEWYFRDVLVVVPNFFAGAAIHWMTNRAPASLPLLRYLTNLLAASIPLACFLPGNNLPVVSLLILFFAVIFGLAEQKNLCQGFWKLPLAVYLGDVSYSLYMTHTLAQKIVYKLLPSTRFILASAAMKMTVLGVYAVAIVVFCLGMYYCVEKPCREIVRRRKPAHLLQASPA